jgi:acetylglutamate kinase
MKPKLHIIKIGGNIIDDPSSLDRFIHDVSSLKEPFILVHGGGKIATGIAEQLGIPTQMVDGRRITDEQTLNVVVMVYAGLVNKTIVAKLQADHVNAIGMCGADANIITATLRKHPTIDYGKVGDITQVNAGQLQSLLQMGFTSVIAPVTHDRQGNLLNTNADTIASCIAVALSDLYEVHLHYCFEKNGVLKNIDDDQSVISQIDQQLYEQLKADGTIHSGMIPKLDNAFGAIANGVHEVNLMHALQFTSLFTSNNAGTKLIR